MHLYDRARTITNLADTRVDSPHTSDLSPPETQFRTLFFFKKHLFIYLFLAIKVAHKVLVKAGMGVWGGGRVALLFRITQHVFDERCDGELVQSFAGGWGWESKRSAMRNRAVNHTGGGCCGGEVAALLSRATRGWRSSALRGAGGERKEEGGRRAPMQQIPNKRPRERNAKKKKKTDQRAHPSPRPPGGAKERSRRLG